METKKIKTAQLNLQVLRAVANACNGASKDLTRYLMNSVLIEKDGDMVNVVATDGHQMSCQSFPIENMAIDCKLLFETAHLKALKEMLKVFKKCDGSQIFVFTSENNSPTYRYLDGTINVILETERYYPDYKQLWCKYRTSVEFGFNPEVIMKLYEAIGGGSTKELTGIRVELCPTDLTKPWTVKTLDGKRVGMFCGMQLPKQASEEKGVA